jgi:hypothetical protein
MYWREVEAWVGSELVKAGREVGRVGSEWVETVTLSPSDDCEKAGHPETPRQAQGRRGAEGADIITEGADMIKVGVG